jgi:hypothetical protein
MAIKVANNQSLTAITALPSAVSSGAMVLLETQTASSSSTIDFTSGIDDTYDEYVFKFYNIHLSANTPFGFQGNAAGGSGFDETITSTSFFSRHDEGDGTSQLAYSTANDQAQGTSFQRLATDQGTGNDENMGGFLHLFNPSSTTFVKHFISNCQSAQASDFSMQRFAAGYFNTTSAIDEIQFKPESGTFDGVIKLYGIS